jgi:tetratricopeptide (TPR) repeat protein
LVILFAIDRPDPSSALLAGIAAGLSLATRPNLLPILALVPPYLFWRCQGREPWLRRVLLFSLPIALALTFLAFRSQVISGDPRTPVMNPGTVFYEGNNPLSMGTSAVYPPTVFGQLEQMSEHPDSPHITYREVARASTGKDLTIRQVNAYWANLGLGYLRQDPLASLRHFLGKAHLGLHAYRWHDVNSAAAYDHRLPIPAMPFAVLSALACLGLLLELGNWRRALLFYGLFASQLGVMIVFYASARQRLPLMPAMLFFSLVALEAMRQWFRPPAQRARLASALLLLALLGTLFFYPRQGIEDSIYRRHGGATAIRLLADTAEAPSYATLEKHTSLAIDAMAAAPWARDRMRPAFLSRRHGEVAERVLKSLAKLPPSPQRNFDRALILVRLGRKEEGKELLQPLARMGFRAYRKANQCSYPSFYLGRMAAQGGDLAAAKAHLETALQRNRDDPFALAEFYALDADPSYRDRILATVSQADLHYLLGQALFAQGRYPEAAKELARLTNLLPDFRFGLVYLAAALGESGHLEEGVRAYRAALAINIEPVLLEEEIRRLFSHWLAANPSRPDAWLVTAQVLRQLGYFADAQELIADKTFPKALRPMVDRELKNLRRVLEP